MSDAIEAMIDDRVVNKCPACGTPFCVGNLGSGTAIRVQCKRRECVHHVTERKPTNKPFMIIVQ